MESKLVALFNFSETEKEIAVEEEGDYHDLFTGKQICKNAVKIPSGGFVWMVCEFI